MKISIILSLLLSGCSSIGHTFGPSSKDETNLIYAGSRNSAYKLTHELDGGHADGWEIILIPFVYLIGIIDLPFTLGLDTILLPYTIPVTVNRKDDADVISKP